MGHEFTGSGQGRGHLLFDRGTGAASDDEANVETPGARTGLARAVDGSRSSSRTASSPFWWIGWWTVVRGGSV